MATCSGAAMAHILMVQPPREQPLLELNKLPSRDAPASYIMTCVLQIVSPYTLVSPSLPQESSQGLEGKKGRVRAIPK